MKQGLANQVAIITGASSGIGRAAARIFSDAGAKLVLADIESDQGEQLVEEIRGMGGAALFVRCDVSRASDVERLVLQAVDHYGRLDCAFNNAGIESNPAPTAECTEENWDRTLAVNLKGVWLCMKYELQQMLKSGGGAIVNTSSVAGLVGFEGLPAYVASKHGIIGLTKTAALEYAKRGIRINAVCPGVIDTPMIERATASKLDAAQLIAAEPIGRIGTAEEIGNAALWLLSNQASFVTGATLAVDGGWVAR